MSHVFPRLGRDDLPKIERGEGIYLFDEADKKYLDGSSGPATSCLGHSDAAVNAAICAQLEKVAYAHTSFFTSEPAERLAEKLIANAPGDLDRVYFLSGGSEAMEASLKLARQYYLEIGQPQRRHIIARRQSYHGNTLGALATGGNKARREAFSPLLVETTHVSPCNFYRDGQEGETPEDYGLRLASELDAQINALGPENVMAFVAEPVVGATMGAVPPVEGYFKQVREICDRHGVLLVLDEVMCGMGRTGTLFACEQDGVAPDITTIAKGLGAGYQPIGAMLCTAKIYDAISKGSGFFQHGHTYMGHPTVCVAGLAVMGRLVDDGLVAQSMERGKALDKALNEAFGQHPHVGDSRGRGLFRGLEIVQDRETKQPFTPENRINKKLNAAAFQAGLMIYPGGGTIDGKNGDHVLLAPPFIIEQHQIDELVDKLDTAFRAVF